VTAPLQGVAVLAHGGGAPEAARRERPVDGHGIGDT